MMNKLFSGLLAIFLLTLATNSPAQEVSRNIADLSAFPWKLEWSTAKGSFKSVKDVPAGNNVDKKSSMAIHISFDKGFSYYNISPVDKKIPGVLKKISVWGKKEGDIPCIISFNVENQQKGKKYEWSPKLTEQWQEHNFNIPANWPKVEKLGITSHNWSKQNDPHEGTIFLNNLQITTDMSSVKDKKSLVTVSASTGLPRNIFLYDQDIKYTINLGSWIGKPLKGKLDISVKDITGKKVYSKNEDITLGSALSKDLKFKPKKYGIYTTDILVKLEGQPDFKQTSRCAWIPEIAKSNPQEKRMSPWGLNIHGGIEGVAYNSIAKLGFCWIRDYAYTYGWLPRGYNNGDWAGWPWYITMDNKIKESGLKVLPCMSNGINDFIKKNPEPPNEWKDILMKFMMKFPEYDAFEPDNELDLHLPKELAADNYQSYGKYHKRYAEIIHFMKPDAWVTTQGTAGFKSHIVRQMIKEGYFKDIDVINGHYYTGIYPALTSQTNENTGQGNDVPQHFYDRLREFVEVADSDGKNRQSWITEFGWDTLAVKIVTEKEQAAYAQRGYTIGLIAGVDKMFWYWNLDTKKAPNTYFDGMGIFDPKDDPKPVAASIASMIHFLKLPKPVGSFEMGPNSFGHVFEDRGRLVALAFKVDKDKPGPTVEFKTGKLYDMYANPLNGRKHKLDIDPIWIDGISKDDPLVKETVYDLKSNWLVLCAAGDECVLQVAVNNTRKEAINADVKVTAPKGWKVTQDCPKIAVSPGKKEVFTLKVQVDPQAKAGTDVIDVQVTEKDGVVKNMPTQVKVVPPATLSTIALTGEPGTCDLNFSMLNNSLKARNFKIKAVLPKSWKAVPEVLEIKDLAPKTSKDVSFKVTWNSDYSEKDKAEIKVFNQEETEITAVGIVPNARALPLAKNIKFDGDFSDWPASAKLPEWAIGKIGMPKDVEIYTAYAPEGLYVGAKIAPSMVAGSNPKVFWSMDCLEVCIDSKNDKNKRDKYSATDHQFWIVPVVKENKAYLGRWKRNDEIKAIEYDIQGIKSFAKNIPNGYAMEVLIPAEKITGFKGQKGNKIGLSINLTAPGRTETITCYWPLPKTEGVIEKPYIWATSEMK